MACAITAEAAVLAICAALKSYKAECLACHEPARASDLVYDYAYPVLRN